MNNRKIYFCFKRLFDIIFSFTGLLLVFPLFIVIAVLIKLTSSGPIVFYQTRTGLNGNQFTIYKFRTMKSNEIQYEKQLTTESDNRITKVGNILRKTKIDELPQLCNVLQGTMSFVGPRPEVPRYTKMYDEKQQKVLCVKPGITDLASIHFRNENELLTDEENAEKVYIESIMPKKIELNLEYIANMSFLGDIKIIIITIIELLR